jgi:hypothetical protein
MGGFGSGRHGGRDTTDNCRSLDVRRLQRERMLTPGHAFKWQWARDGKEVASIQMRIEVNCVILDYRTRINGGDWKPMEYPVYLEWTGCNYGGQRAWFLCPAMGCGRRMAKLFMGRSGIFACRHCYRLAYACQRENGDSRATRRADKIRERLGWEPGILNGNGRKPKGMHWRTFERLSAEHDSFVGLSLTGMAERLGLLNQRLDGLADKLHGES